MKEQILSILEKTNISKKEFAESLGVSPGNLSDLLSGRVKSFSSETVLKIQEKYNISPLWLMTGEGPMELPNGGSPGDAKANVLAGFGLMQKINGNKKIKEAVDLISKMPDGKLDKLLVFIREILKD